MYEILLQLVIITIFFIIVLKKFCNFVSWLTGCQLGIQTFYHIVCEVTINKQTHFLWKNRT